MSCRAARKACHTMSPWQKRVPPPILHPGAAPKAAVLHSSSRQPVALGEGGLKERAASLVASAGLRERDIALLGWNMLARRKEGGLYSANIKFR